VACVNKADLIASMSLARELGAKGIQSFFSPSFVGGDDSLVVYRANCGRRAFSLKNGQEVIDQMGQSPSDTNKESPIPGHCRRN